MPTSCSQSQQLSPSQRSSSAFIVSSRRRHPAAIVHPVPASLALSQLQRGSFLYRVAAPQQRSSRCLPTSYCIGS